MAASVKKYKAAYSRFLIDEHMPRLEELVGGLVPLRTAVDSLGLDFEVVAKTLETQPGLARRLKVARATGLIDAQKRVEAGAKSWQSVARILESADPDHWQKGTMAGRKPAAPSPYQMAIGKRKGKS